MPGGPVLIAFDGSEGSDRAIASAGELLAPRRALVVVVWKAGLGFELVGAGAPSTAGLPPALLDVRTALEVDRRTAEAAQRLAEQGAAFARDAGFEAESTVVADDVETPVDESLADLAERQDAQAVVVHPHTRGRVAEAILGSVTRGLLRRTTRPVVAVRSGAGASET